MIITLSWRHIYDGSILDEKGQLNEEDHSLHLGSHSQELSQPYTVKPRYNGSERYTLVVDLKTWSLYVNFF